MKFTRPQSTDRSPLGLSGNRSMLIVVLVVMFVLALAVGRQFGVSLFSSPRPRLPREALGEDDGYRATFMVEDDPQVIVELDMLDRLPQPQRERLAELVRRLIDEPAQPKEAFWETPSSSVLKLVYASKGLLTTSVTVDGVVISNERLNVPELPDAGLRQLHLKGLGKGAWTWVLVAPSEQVGKLVRGDVVRARGSFFRLRQRGLAGDAETLEPVIVSGDARLFLRPGPPSGEISATTMILFVAAVVVIVLVMMARMRRGRTAPVDWKTMLSEKLADDPAFFEEARTETAESDEPSEPQEPTP